MRDKRFRTYDATPSRFPGGLSAAIKSLAVFLHEFEDDIEKLRIDPEPAYTPLSQSAEAVQVEINNLRTERKKAFLAATDIELDVHCPQVRRTFSEWAYISGESNVLRRGGGPPLFESTDGEVAAAYQLDDDSLRRFINALSAAGLAPPSWQEVIDQ